MTPDAKIPFGERLPDGRIVTASETPRGLACDCICPQCSGALQAHQGDKLAWHFQHNTISRGGCAYGFETGLHKFAKQLVAETGGIFFPPLVANFNGSKETVQPGRWAKLRNVALERHISIGDAFIVPDIVTETRELDRSSSVLSASSRTVFIEIFVNHETQDAKRRFLASNNIASFEIDLSFLRLCNGSLYSYTSDILRDAPRYWIWHPELTQANAALELKFRARQQLLRKLEDQRRRFSLRNAEQEKYRRELIARRDAAILQYRQERELDEYNLNAARDTEQKRREREKWERECEHFLATFINRFELANRAPAQKEEIE